MKIPKESSKYGLITNGLGAHSGRTIMLKDMRKLLDGCSPNSSLSDYEQAILKENILLKKTGAARKESFSRLRRLFGLDEEIYLYRILRQLWDHQFEAQPVLLILYAIARDPILRSTVELVIDTDKEEILTSQDFEFVVNEKFGSQLKSTTLASIGRNVASSWTQSGHFQGRSEKVRKNILSHTITVVYALLLAYLCGNRGELLFRSSWGQLLDISLNELHLQTQIASKQGWLEYRKVANVTEITFNHLLKDL